MIWLNKSKFKKIQRYILGNTDINNIDKSQHTNLLQFIYKTNSLDPNKYILYCVQNKYKTTLRWLIKCFKKHSTFPQIPYIKDKTLIDTLNTSILYNLDINCIKIFYPSIYTKYNSETIVIKAIMYNNIDIIQLHYKYNKAQPTIEYIRYAIKHERLNILKYLTTLINLHNYNMYFTLYLLFIKTNIDIECKYKMLTLIKPYLCNRCLKMMVNTALQYKYITTNKICCMTFLSKNYEGINFKKIKYCNENIQKEAKLKKYIFEVKNVCDIEYKYIFL